jgi:hypothetical protein
MDNIVLWVALIGVIGTLGGVWLGHWLQSRNIKRQRDWMLQDQKLEWTRLQKQEKLKPIEAFVEDTLKVILKEQSVTPLLPREQRLREIEKYKERTAEAMPNIYIVMGEDRELADLLVEFEKRKDAAFDALFTSDADQRELTARRLAEIAGEIKHRISNSLQETFD